MMMTTMMTMMNVLAAATHVVRAMQSWDVSDVWLVMWDV